MFRSKSNTFLLVTIIMLAVSLIYPQQVFAAPPTNDDIEGAIELSEGIPVTADMSEATLSAFEADYCVQAGFPDSVNSKGVWFVIYPEDYVTFAWVTYTANEVLGYQGDAIFTGEPGNLDWIGGGYSSGGGTSGGFGWGVISEDKYYILYCGLSGEITFTYEYGNPKNDNFAFAKTIDAVPFEETLDNWDYASLEPNEPQPNGDIYSSATVWYKFTPVTTGTYRVRTIPHPQYPFPVAVYTGSELNDLQPVGIRPPDVSNLVTFKGDAGIPYYIQVGGSRLFPFETTLTVEAVPPPEVDFIWTPIDPNRLDTVMFSSTVSDPEWFEVEAWLWDFGDGTTSSEANPTHQFTADGDYTVNATVYTTDGRVASTSKVVSIRTHDVSITRFGLPGNARAGQTRRIYVYVANPYYKETVRVDLYVSLPNDGWQLFGSLTQTLPPEPKNRPYRFAFTYTFTASDAAIGKVNFKAVATIFDTFGAEVRDAIPGDNTAISLPVRVR